MNHLQEARTINVKTKLISFIHKYYRIFDNHGRLIGFSKFKGFKLKEEILIYTDETMREELFSIKADRIIDFSAVYNITDSKTGEKLGSLRRSGLKSIARDHWCIYDADDYMIYEMKEDSLLLALVRRLLTNLVPATYCLTQNGQETGIHFKQNFNPFLLHYTADLSQWPPDYDKRLSIAAIILLLSIEKKQGT